MNQLSYLFALLLLSMLIAGCSIRNSPATPGGLSYFTFYDKSKGISLKGGEITVQRVSLMDSTKVVKTQSLSTPGAYALFTNQFYGYMFQLDRGDGLIVMGPNKLRLSYTGKADIDWLEFNNTAEEWVSPAQVKFNGRVLDRNPVNEPVPSSYLYVLE